MCGDLPLSTSTQNQQETRRDTIRALGLANVANIYMECFLLAAAIAISILDFARSKTIDLNNAAPKP
jgi:hypothetical protein